MTGFKDLKKEWKDGKEDNEWLVGMVNEYKWAFENSIINPEEDMLNILPFVWKLKQIVQEARYSL